MKTAEGNDDSMEIASTSTSPLRPLPPPGWAPPPPATPPPSLPAPTYGATFLPPQPAPPPVRRRGWLWVVLGAALVAVVGFVGLFVLGLVIEAASTTLVDDDLDDGDGPFVQENDPLVALSYEDGGYAMVVEPADDNLQATRTFWDPSVREVEMSVNYEIRDHGDTWYNVGLSCVHKGGMYDFIVGLEGAVIQRESVREGRVEVLAEDFDIRLPEAGTLEFTCQGGGDGTTVLVGRVDGVEIEASDSGGYDWFSGMGLLAASDDGLDVLFDDPLATRL